MLRPTALLLAVLAAAAPAQMTLKGTPSLPSGKTGPMGTTPLNPPKATVKVRYLYEPEWKVTVTSQPQLPFACVQGEVENGQLPDPVTNNTITCTAISAGTRVTLRAYREPAKSVLPPGVIIPPQAQGKQWVGDCFVQGTECTLNLRASPFSAAPASRSTWIDWSAKP